MNVLANVGLLCFSNVFITLAWYGHLKFKEMEWSKGLGLIAIGKAGSNRLIAG